MGSKSEMVSRFELNFFSSIRLQRSQVAQDPTQNFVVDGDSLLFDALADQCLDAPSIPLAHLVWIVEDNLCKLLGDQRSVDVVFFSCMASSAWYTAPTAQAQFRKLARTLLQQHLQHLSRPHGAVLDSAPLARNGNPLQLLSSRRLLSKLRVFSFTSWSESDEEWRKYLELFYPGFILIGGLQRQRSQLNPQQLAHHRSSALSSSLPPPPPQDQGHPVTTQSSQLLKGSDAAADCAAAGTEPHLSELQFQTLAFQSMMMDLSRHWPQLPIVSSRHVIFRDSFMFGFTVDVTSGNVLADFSALPFSAPALLQAQLAEAACTDLDFDGDLWSQVCSFCPPTSRQAFYSYALTKALAFSTTAAIDTTISSSSGTACVHAPVLSHALLSKVIVLHAVLLDSLPLRDRAQVLSAPLLDLFHSQAAFQPLWHLVRQCLMGFSALLQHGVMHSVANRDNRDVDIDDHLNSARICLDLFDGRLLLSLLHLALRPQGLPTLDSEDAATCSAWWRGLTQLQLSESSTRSGTRSGTRQQLSDSSDEFLPLPPLGDEALRATVASIWNPAPSREEKQQQGGLTPIKSAINQVNKAAAGLSCSSRTLCVLSSTPLLSPLLFSSLSLFLALSLSRSLCVCVCVCSNARVR